MKHTRELTQGNILIGLWAFAVPLMLGNVMQQLYNLVDTWVVGKYIGEQALAAVGASYTLVTFLTSVILGLCLGAGAFFSMAYGKKDWDAFRNGLVMSFTAIGGLALIVMVVVYLLLNYIIQWLQVPQETFADMRTYLVYVMAGFFATFLYNYYANVLRSVGNSVIPLVFLAVSVVLNIGLDLLFVIPLQGGIAGAAVATVISQYISGIGIGLYFIKMYPEYRPQRKDVRWDGKNLKQIMSLSGFTCLQQSVMNFGILMIQGLVNSFGAVIMAAFAVAVKIDTIAYMPVQDFGNAFSVFAAQNFGARKRERIREGVKYAVLSVVVFCVIVSSLVVCFSHALMNLFVDAGSAVSEAGAWYLQIEGAFYVGIGILFLLYGYFRAVNKPVVSVILTVISLGMRVALAYGLTKIAGVGVTGIWISIPIGWFLADFAGIIFYRRNQY